MNNQRSSSSKQVSAQARRSARFNVDLGTPMIFCVAEAVIFLILLTALNLFVKTPGNQNVIAIINIAVPIFYLLSAGILCAVCTVKSTKTKKAKQEAKQSPRRWLARWSGKSPHGCLPLPSSAGGGAEASAPSKETVLLW